MVSSKRSRLVQEGDSVYNQASFDDDVMDGTTVNATTTAMSSKGNSYSKNVSSSLQRAMKASSGSSSGGHKRRSATSTSYVIGAANLEKETESTNFDEADPTMMDHEEMALDDDTHPTRSNPQHHNVPLYGNLQHQQHQHLQNFHHVQPPPPRQHQHQQHHNFSNRQRATAYQYQIENTQSHYNRNPPPTTLQTSYVISAPSSAPPSSSNFSSSNYEPPQKMEGVEDLSVKEPLVVLDGANVAYAYTKAKKSSLQHATAALSSSSKPEPDSVGIKVATDYFRQQGCRVLVVLPQYWFHPKPLDDYGVINELKSQGLIVAAPPTDDDDAYALTISQREERRSLQRGDRLGPGFVLSNDLFRDAEQRDTSLRHWLRNGRNETIGPGRISYTFCDMGTMNDHGENILDFVPNPRHPLIIYIESRMNNQHHHHHN